MAQLMQNSVFQLIAVIIAILLVATRKGRIILGLTLALLLMVAAWRTFVRQTTASPLQSAAVELQPTWAGPCFGSNDSAIVKQDGRYFLTPSGTGAASASCFDWRFWR